MSQLPDEVREKLAELELELSEGKLIVQVLSNSLCKKRNFD